MKRLFVENLRVATVLAVALALILVALRAFDSTEKPASPHVESLRLAPVPSSAASSAAITGSGVQDSKLEWHDATEFDLEGKGWQDTEASYDRLPVRAKTIVPTSVWDLGKQSAGLCVRFETDAPEFDVRWSLTSGNLAMPHMPATGVSGVDVYAADKSGHWQFVQIGRPAKQEDNITSISTGAQKGHARAFLVYLPLYNGTSKLEIGIPPGESIRKTSPRPAAASRPIVVYGTSIVQGGCASRPGMSHVAILGRRLNRPMINLGFSGSGKMEPEVATLLTDLDPAAFMIDCLWNISGLPADEISNRIKNFIRIIRKARPLTPIVLVGQSNIHAAAHPTGPTRAQEYAVKQLTAEGVKGLFTIPGKDLIGSDGDATVDGVHPNDLGMERQAEAMLPVLRKALSSGTAGHP